MGGRSRWYSVVSQDESGQRFQVKLNVIPVSSALIERPLFGGSSAFVRRMITFVVARARGLYAAPNA